MNVYLSPLVHDSVRVKCVYKFVSAKVISESSWPPGGSLTNLVSFTAARKHGAELQLCSAQSSIAHRAKGTHGSSKDATLLIACLYPCLWVWVCVCVCVSVCLCVSVSQSISVFTASSDSLIFSDLPHSSIKHTRPSKGRVQSPPTYTPTNTHYRDFSCREFIRSHCRKGNRFSFIPLNSMFYSECIISGIISNESTYLRLNILKEWAFII